MINLRTIQAVLAASLLPFFASAALANRLDEIKARGNLGCVVRAGGGAADEADVPDYGGVLVVPARAPR